MEWFKFYNDKWLSDRAILSSKPVDRLCFITLLCVTAQSDERNGVIVRYEEEEVIRLTNLCAEDEESAQGFTKRFVEKRLVEFKNKDVLLIKNFEKRQNTNLTGAERAKRYRDKQNSDDSSITQSDDSNARVDESRVDKNREEKPSSSVNYLSALPTEDIIEITTRFAVSEKQLKDKAESLKLYCESKGRKYKNYKSFLLNAIKKDFPERENKQKYKMKLSEDGKTMIQTPV